MSYKDTQRFLDSAVGRNISQKGEIVEGSETYAYRFLKHCMETRTMTFRAKDVKAWLRALRYDKTIYDAQVHNLILIPLVDRGYITKTNKKRYEVNNAALIHIEELRRKKSGPTKEEDQLLDIPANAIMPETHKEEDHDEWDAYVASQLKKSAKEP